MTPATPAAVIDWTPIVVAIVGGVFSVIGIVFTAWVSSHMKDQTAALALGNAVKNSLGAVQNAVDAGLASHPLQTTLPAGTSPQLAAGVQYVVDQAGPEATRLGITPDAIAAKVSAQIGLSRVVAPVAPGTVTTTTTPVAPVVAPVAPAPAP